MQIEREIAIRKEILHNNSIIYYLCAESTAKSPVRDTAQCRNR
jgi:hypothetical protein